MHRMTAAQIMLMRRSAIIRNGGNIITLAEREIAKKMKTRNG